jgi:hypothetical protein
LLGGVYGIAADFFNRHLPGTEAISGRLISRLPSTVQIDFDDLYEGVNTFYDLFGKTDEMEGHKEISKAMERNFLFRVGWDYFPISNRDWEESRRNSSLSSGYEVLMQKGLENVFQFNLNHRISVFSQPPGHPQTGQFYSPFASPSPTKLIGVAILIFYPMLPIEPSPNSKVGSAKDENRILFRSVPNMLPNPAELRRILEDDETKDWEKEGHKQNSAFAFDRNFRIHIKRHFEDAEKKKVDYTTFVHLFGAPLFKMVAANWARLTVRRSFDLDLLEWRPKQRLTSHTIDEIKSRRVAIARHQRDINSSLEVLRALMLEERGQQVTQEDCRQAKSASQTDRLTNAQILALVEGMCSWNRGRSSGLVSAEMKDDAWESIFWDYFELKASMDALEKRADKIQDGLVGQIQVVGGETSGTLNTIAFLFSLILLPFSIVGSIYGANLTT